MACNDMYIYVCTHIYRFPGGGLSTIYCVLSNARGASMSSSLSETQVQIVYSRTRLFSRNHERSWKNRTFFPEEIFFPKENFFFEESKVLSSIFLLTF